MMYNNRLSCAIKAGGKVLREFKDTVFLPYGSEYTILVKNLNTVRALVHITIDGQNVTRNGIVINANSETELERMLKENLNEGNRFKFIERTAQIEQHRGVKLEDGIVRIEYRYEKTYPTPLYYVNNQGMWYGSGISVYNTSPIVGSTLRNAKSIGINSSSTHVSHTTAEFKEDAGIASNFVEQGYNDAGITVPGSISNQKFTEVSNFSLESEKHVMIFKLLGETADNEPLRTPVTVKSKPRCQTCDKQNKATSQFCSACGTSLKIIA